MAAVLHNSIGASPYGRRSPASRWSSIGLIALVHVALLAGLMQIPEVRDSMVEAAPVFVQLMMAPAPRPEPPTPEAPRPIEKPVPRPVEKRQLLASQTPAPSSELAPAPVPPAAAAPPPAPAPAAAVEAPPVVVPPSFVAAYLDNPAPAYPASSQFRGESGRVMLAVHVSPEGRADEVKVVQTSGFERLDNAALDAVKRWRFVPARQGDKALAAWVQVPILFDPKTKPR